MKWKDERMKGWIKRWKEERLNKELKGWKVK